MNSNLFNIKLHDQEGKEVNAEVLGIEKISSGIKQIDGQEITKLFGIESSQLNRPNYGEIDVLLGLQQFGFHPVKIDNRGHLLLMENRFGLTIAGSHPNVDQTTTIRESCSMVKHAIVMHLVETVERFYNIESLGIMCQPKCGACQCGKCHPGGKNMSLQDEREYKLIEDGIKFNEERKRWTASYPWIREPMELPNNKRFALARMYSTERRIEKDEIQCELYNSQMQDMIDRDASRKVSEEELVNYEGPKYYITHHAVIKPSSKSTPCRIVFNSSAKYCGSSLNDYLAKGPSLLNSLFGVLLRWRQNKIGFIGDIAKMYHSIDIPYADQMTHLYFWRDFRKELSPETYAITKVNMGDRPSSCIAQISLRKSAEESQQKFPEAAEIILKNAYMDDIPGSVNSEEDVKLRMKEIEIVLQSKGFKMKEWIYNGKQQDKDKSNAQLQVQLMMGMEDNPEIETESVLGMHWNVNNDLIKFNAKIVTKFQTTKRIILAISNSIFDPMGIITPFTVRAKIILRKVWAYSPKIGWDDAIPNEILNEWNTFMMDMPNIQNLGFERSLTPEDAIGKPFLIIFSDGSKEAYGAVVYIRWKTEKGYICRLIAEKSRIAPLKTIDIVRLKLCGAIVSTRLRNTIQKELNFEFQKVIHLVDSEIVHAMIHKESYGFGTFVGNRVGEIQQTSEPEEWGWIEGGLNIADMTTRGCSVEELGPQSEWCNGPQFLTKPDNEWPVRWEVKKDVQVPELKRSQQFIGVVEVNNSKEETLAIRIGIEHFSKWKLLIHTTARILQLYTKFKRGSNLNMDLTLDALEKAEQFWITEGQRGIQLKKYIKLQPHEEHGIIVVGERTARWIANRWNHQEFILLPKDSAVSILIARYIHEKGGHLGEAATVSKIRSKFWIVGVRSIVKTIISRCRKCKEKLKMLCEQVMSPLPLERIKPGPAFLNIGIDYFGPFNVKGEVQKRVTGKCYGVLFVCLCSRAVHADISNNYSTDSFLHVLRRFASIRGWPRKIFSDNGTQLVGASNELKDLIKDLDWEHIKNYSIEKGSGTEWCFSSADAPWYNGATESLVKCTKRALNAAVGDQSMKFNEMQTVMFEAAQLVNQRPIGRHPSKPEEESYLCANDLILGRASSDIPQGPFEDKVTVRQRFLFTQSVISAFWRRWIEEVFPNLVIQPKWHTAKRNLKEGDVVLEVGCYQNSSTECRWKSSTSET